jgi:alkylation response protein AidB-like acyl-CoA dehydrogenase
VLDGDAWVVNGQKVWSSYAHLADWCILLTRTDPVSARHQGLTMLLLDMRSPGVEVRPLPQLTGEHEFNEIFLTDVRVPRSATLGLAGEGWAVAMTTLGAERGTFAISLVANLEAQLRTVLDDARRGAGDDPEVRRRLARHWVEVQALRAAACRTLSQLAATGDAGPGAPGIKLAWSQTTQQLIQLALEIAGEDGVGARSSWAYDKLRSRGNTIEMGTSEIVRGLVAERVLGLPRSR